MTEQPDPSALTYEPVAVGRWNDTMRRARLGRKSGIKKFAMILSSYADADGTNVRPGIARLAVDAEIGESTARRYMDKLRTLGLIVLTQKGNRRARKADVYRLTISAQFEATVPTGEEYRALVEAARNDNRTAQKGRRMGVQRSPKPSAEPTDDVESSALTQPSAETGYQRSLDDLSALTMASAHLPGITYQQKTDLPAGGTLPPDPLRPQDPPSSGPGTDIDRSLSEPLTPAQDQESESLPRVHASAATPLTDAPHTTNQPRQCERGHRAMPAGRDADGDAHCALCRAQDRGVHLASAS